MRILIVPGSDWIFGPKQYLNDIAEIIGEGNEVFVWHFDLFKMKKPCFQEITNVKMIRPWDISSDSLLVYYSVNFLPHAVQFVQTVRELMIDIVIVANLIPALWAFALAPQRTLKVFAFQDYFPESASVYYGHLPRTLRRILETFAFLVNKLGLKLANLTLCPCASLINLSKDMGCRGNYFLPNGVDTSYFDPNKFNAELGKQLGLSKHTLVFYGLIENWIDFETMLAGFKELKKEIADAKLLIIGSTLTNFAKVLEKSLQDEDLTRDVVFTGYIPDELVPYYVNLGSICLLPYKTDAFSGKIRLPMKFFAYSAMGKIVLSVPLPEVKRLNLEHVFFYNDKESFAQQASAIFKNANLLNDLGHYAREFAKNFDYLKLAKKCEEILQENQKARELRSPT